MSRVAWFVWALVVAVAFGEILMHLLPWWVGLPVTLVLGLIAGQFARHMGDRHPPPRA